MHVFTPIYVASEFLENLKEMFIRYLKWLYSWQMKFFKIFQKLFCYFSRISQNIFRYHIHSNIFNTNSFTPQRSVSSVDKGLINSINTRIHDSMKTLWPSTKATILCGTYSNSLIDMVNHKLNLQYAIPQIYE